MHQINNVQTTLYLQCLVELWNVLVTAKINFLVWMSTLLLIPWLKFLIWAFTGRAFVCVAIKLKTSNQPPTNWPTVLQATKPCSTQQMNFCSLNPAEEQPYVVWLKQCWIIIFPTTRPSWIKDYYVVHVCIIVYFWTQRRLPTCHGRLDTPLNRVICPLPSHYTRNKVSVILIWILLF